MQLKQILAIEIFQWWW